MANPPISPALAGALERAAFEAGDRVTAADLNLEHRYRTELLRHHLRFNHGWGVVCGLMVVALDDPLRPWLIRVCPGYGVSPCGDEIVMPRSLDYDLSAIAWRRPPAASPLYVGLRFGGSPVKPVTVAARGCGCGSGCEDDVRASRTRDRAYVVTTWQAWKGGSPRFDLCSGDTPPCPLCPPTCDLLLASVALPGSTTDRIGNSQIDNSIRQNI